MGVVYRGVRWGARRMKMNLACCKSRGAVADTAPCWEVGTGASERTRSRSCLSSRPLSGVLRLGMKSPGTVRGAPYTISAEEHPKSSLGAVRIPNRTQGSSRIQLGPVRRALKADFR